MFESTSILPTFTLPWYSVASSSTIGAIARQGPHQVAQKSTRTGLSDFSTSWSKFASVTSTIPLPAMFSFSYVVNVALSADASSEGAAAFGDLDECFPFGRPTFYRNTGIGCEGRGKSRKEVGSPETVKPKRRDVEVL